MIKLIVALGNPGSEYTDTRHNAGVWLLDKILKHHNLTLNADSKFFGLYGQIQSGNYSVKLLFPTTFMNLSGQAVSSIASFFKISVSEILVLHDDLDLEPGIVRIKKGGGHGGHNGLRNIIERMGQQKDFYRLRIGIGHPGNRNKVLGYVLKKPNTDDQICIDQALDLALKQLEKIVAGEFQLAMNELHQRKQNEKQQQEQ